MEDTTEFWKRHIAAIGQEGVAVTVYAKRHGLSLASLYYWRQKLMAADGVAPNPPKLGHFSNFSDSLPCAASGQTSAVSKVFRDGDRSA